MKRIVIILLAAVLVLLGGRLVYKNFFGEFAGIGKEALLTFSRTTGGDMRGSRSETAVTVLDEDRALITVSHADWHFQDPMVKEYAADRAVLSEIREVFLRYRMQNWDGRRFTKIFVADGASTGYSFGFEDKYVNFSSQIYPDKYSKKLDEINDIVKKYLENAERLPGLMLPVLTEEEQIAADRPQNGLLELQVFEYSKGRLHYRFSNGTGEDVKLGGSAVLKEKDTGKVVPAEGRLRSERTVYAGRREEESLELKQRLEPGSYCLEAAGLLCDFEIGFAD